MHPKEFKRQKTGTGRLTKLSLKNSEILMGIDFNEDKRVIKMISDERYFPMVLFPGQNSVNLSSENSLTLPEGKTLLVFVLDATWRLARKIMWVSTILHKLPKISFTPDEKSRFKIKKQPMDYCVSTIEAVYYLLDVLEKKGFEKLERRHDALLDAIDSLVKFQESYISKSTEPTRHYKAKFFLKKQGL